MMMISGEKLIKLRLHVILCHFIHHKNITSPDITRIPPQWVSKIVSFSMAEQFTGQFFQQKSETQKIKTDFTSHCETPDRLQYAQYLTQQFQWHWESHVGYLTSLTCKSQSDMHEAQYDTV